MSPNTVLPPAEKSELQLGYMRLTDSAPLIVAKELGFFEQQGIDVSLVREISWANLRDRLVTGDLDAAQLLAPLPMMTSYGAGGIRANILTGLSLSLNGNAITLAQSLWEQIVAIAPGSAPDPVLTARKLKHLIEDMPRGKVLTLATVHLFSMHTFLLRLWLNAGGIDPDKDVRLIVLPPEQMCDSLARGVIDGYCVGEPWNSLAVQRGTGCVAVTGYQIWNNAPEKVLGVTESWHHHHPVSHLRLRQALMQASLFLAKPDNRKIAAEILSKEEYLNLSESVLSPSLIGHFQFAKTLDPVAMPDFHVFGKFHAGFPWRSQAEWIMEQCSSVLSRDFSGDTTHNLVQQCYRTDLYREAARSLKLPAPSSDYKPENVHSEQWELESGFELGPDIRLQIL